MLVKIIAILIISFALVVLGIAASGGAALAYFAFNFPSQAGVATAIAVVGVLLVHRVRVKMARTGVSNTAMDIGHRVTLDSWVNEAEGLARVRYRGTLWDAKVIGTRRESTSFYIRDVDGSTLKVEAEA